MRYKQAVPAGGQSKPCEPDPYGGSGDKQQMRLWKVQVVHKRHSCHGDFPKLAVLHEIHFPSILSISTDALGFILDITFLQKPSVTLPLLQWGSLIL